MDENGKNLSVYELVTKLCEKTLAVNKVAASNSVVKKLRSKAYAILLDKVIVAQDTIVCLEGTNDPYCQLLAWQYVLSTEHNLRQHSQKIDNCVETLKKSVPADTLKNILHIFLQLKNIPREGINNILSTDIENRNPNSFFKYYDASRFKLPDTFICANAKYSNESFHLPKKSNRKRIIQSLESIKRGRESRTPSCRSMKAHQDNLNKDKHDEGYESTDVNYDIWDVVSKTKFNNRRTWETMGNPTPEKELPFATECSTDVSSLLYDVQMLSSSGLYGITKQPTRIIDQKDFIRDIKYILVGIVSQIFVYDESNRIVMVPGISVKGISSSMMQTYCRDAIFCGTCYKALSEMIAVDPYTGSRKQKGYIFAEFCDSIKKYLLYYRVAAISLPDSLGLLKHSNRIKKLSNHLHVLSTVCKVGPFYESQQIPHGVALLNYLYDKVLGLSNKDVAMVLYSILYPCLQVYFNRFLRQWILEGCVMDPYSEFFIMPVNKYLSTRGRTYWTRSYKIHEDIIPQFLSHLGTEILNCGKAMNLLKLCASSSPTCQYLMGTKPNILRCCLSSEQLSKLESNVRCYYLEVIAESGPRLCMENLITRSREDEQIFLTMIAAKRAATLKKIEMDKLKAIKRITDKKFQEMKILKEQYDKAIQQKELSRLIELEQEMKLNENLIKMKKLEERIIQEEAADMIKYYENLFEESEKRIQSINKHMDTIKKINLEDKIEEKQSVSPEPTETPLIESNTHLDEPVNNTQPLDVINANTETATTASEIKEIDNFEQARKNKLKVLSSEMGIECETVTASKKNPDAPLTEAQRNKLKVMSVEMGVDFNKEPDTVKTVILTEAMMEAKRNKMKVLNMEMGFGEEDKFASTTNVLRELTEAQKIKRKVMSSEFGLEPITIDRDINRQLSNMEINRNRNMASNECFYDITVQTCDNDNFVNDNVAYTNEMTMSTRSDELNDNYIIPPKDTSKRYDNLKLDFKKLKKSREENINKTNQSASLFERFMKSPNFEFSKPMSVDSTPVMEFSPLPSLQDRLANLETLSTACSNFTDEGFHFPTDKLPSFRNTVDTDSINQITKAEVENISINCLNYFVQQSIAIPIMAQTDLLQNDLLKYFIKDLNYIGHLISLRNYFFLLDGEFGRNITEGLFEKLYEVDYPKDLINTHTLKHLVFNAVDFSSKYNENSKCLSFKIVSLPKLFDLGNISVLDCLSLSYKVQWPLNILLPSDTIAKYDEVFKFLLKLHRVSWILKKIFMELKLLAKRYGKKEAYLMLSPQYQKLQQYRHIMTHFVQTLQTYIVGEVLQNSWACFEENLSSITNLDQLYYLHTTYIKNILFMCLLNQRSAPIRKVINNIFVVILKFYDYLRYRQWEFDENVFVHPNFRKLEDIFNNFVEFVRFLFKAGHKVARVGYQPQLVQLVDMLDVNEFYSKNNLRQNTV